VGTERTVDAAVDLSLAKWQALDALRSDWCFTPPLFSPPQQGEPVYEVAVRCGTASQQAIIPAGQLPPRLERLVEQVQER
jgi:hypothetical protein